MNVYQEEDSQALPGRVVELRGEAHATLSANAVATVLPADSGASGTQSVATVVSEHLQPETKARFGESGLLNLIERAGPHATTVAIADLAGALAARSVAEAEAREASDRRRDEELRVARAENERLAESHTETRLELAVLQTEKKLGGNPSMALSGSAVAALGGLIVTLALEQSSTLTILGVAVALVGIFQMLWALFAPRWSN